VKPPLASGDSINYPVKRFTTMAGSFDPLSMRKINSHDVKLREGSMNHTIAASAIRVAKNLAEKKRVSEIKEELKTLQASKMKNLGDLKRIENSKTLKKKRQKQKIILEGRSLFLFSKTNCYR
jgi:hypothetical protein